MAPPRDEDGLRRYSLLGCIHHTYRSMARRGAGQLVRSVLRNAHVTVIAQSHETFLAGLDLYEERSDKTYSLVDCISMRVMRRHGVSEVLTADHHFTQEGFEVLIRRS